MIQIYNKIQGYTLVELVVSITISMIILVGLLKFVGDTIYELSISNNSSEMIISLSRVSDVLSDFSGIYEKKSLLVDANPGEGTDILLYSNSGATAGVLFGLIDGKTNKMFTGSIDYSLYNKKYIGFKKLTQTELTSLLGDSSLVYGYTFFNDKIYSDILIEDFQASMYNTGSIINLDLGILLKYDKGKEGISWSELGRSDIYNINLNF